MSGRRAVIIGGGLAGMTVAKELQARGVQVLILEASDRLGGKAGADFVDGRYEEHGYHIFPGWYANVRHLLRQLGVTHHLTDIDKFHLLTRPEGEKPGTVYTCHPFTSWGNLFANLHAFARMMSWPEAVAVVYFILDLCAEPFSNRRFLDRVSVNGFLRSRWYATEGISALHQETVLQASSIPNYEISAMTARKLMLCWMTDWLPYWVPRRAANVIGRWRGAPLPGWLTRRQEWPIMFAVLNGNLHERFIAPFEQHLRAGGGAGHPPVEIVFGRRVTGLEADGGRISRVHWETPDRQHTGSEEADVFALAVPHAQVSAFVDVKVTRVEHLRASHAPDTLKFLADLVRLRSEPMAALHLYLNRRLPRLPREHVALSGSRYGLTCIDVSHHWPGSDRSVLSLIASNFAPLRSLAAADGTPDREAMARFLIEEARQYLPELRDEDIERFYMQPNLHVPLFLNTVGAWPYRPVTQTSLENLFVTGDYCQSEADLTTMEGAVYSGLTTARAALRAMRMPEEVPVVPIGIPPRVIPLLMKWAAFPIVFLVGTPIWGRKLLAKLRSLAGAPSP